jgi:hypothetical protein
MFDAYTEAGTATNAGVFIPVADLPGLTEAELATTGTELEGNLIYGILNALYTTLAPMTTLGIVSLAKGNPSGTGTNRFTESIGFGFQRVINFSAGTVGPLPLPTIGTEAGRGSVQIADVFPSAEIVAQSGAISGAGVVVPDTLITPYGGQAKATTEEDSRDWIGAIMAAIASGVTVRSSTVASAISSRTLPAGIRPTGVAIPPTWYDATNPITGISSASLPYVRVIQETITIEYEILIDPENQTVSLSNRTS